MLFRSYTQTINVTVADTITVQTDTLTAITYSPSGVSISPTDSITGLVAGDTKASLSYTYAGGTTCANGGSCSLGDTGPGGGVVFYSSGGTYYEAAPKTWYSSVTYNGSSYANSNVVYCANSSNVKIDPYNPPSNTSSTGWGGGSTNTQSFSAYCSLGAVGLLATYSGGGKSDWYIPNLTEMNGLVSYWSGRSALLTQFDTTTSVFYWTSDASYNATYGWLLSQPYFNSSQVWSNGGSAFNHQGGKIIPIRSFTAQFSSNYSSSTAPTNAGTYSITPSALTLAGGVSLSNYAAVVYRAGSITINKASQSTLRITSSLAPFSGSSSSIQLTTSGGTDTGTVTYTLVSGGMAQGCAIVGSTLSVTREGTCLVYATKAATQNYLVTSSDTTTINFSIFVSNQPNQTQSVPTQLPVVGKNALETQTVTVPSIDSVTLVSVSRMINGNLATETYYEITGSGFSGATRVTVAGSDATILSVTNTRITIDTAGLMAGPMFIECSDGRIGPTPFYMFTP